MFSTVSVDHPPVTEEEEHEKSGSVWNPSEHYHYEEMVVIEIVAIEIFVQENIQVTASFCFFFDYLGFFIFLF